MEDNETNQTETAIVPVQHHFALEGIVDENVATMMRCTHHLPDDDKTSTADMSDHYLNLGDITIWPCTSCDARIRNTVLTDVLVDSGKILLRNDVEFQAELKNRMKAERGENDG